MAKRTARGMCYIHKHLYAKRLVELPDGQKVEMCTYCIRKLREEREEKERQAAMTEQQRQEEEMWASYGQ